MDLPKIVTVLSLILMVILYFYQRKLNVKIQASREKLKLIVQEVNKLEKQLKEND